MDPIRLAIAAVPLSAYLLVLGWTNCRHRPVVTSGASEVFALGLGLVGLVFVGPIELFRPELATNKFLNYIWFILLALYLLWVVLAAMVSRPRLVIYNITPEQLRPLLSEAADLVDASFRWAGDNLVLPRIGVQLHIDSFPLLRNTSLVSSGSQQNLEGWKRLAKQLKANLRNMPVNPHPSATLFFTIGIMLLLVTQVRLFTAPDEQLAESIGELLAFGWPGE